MSAASRPARWVRFGVDGRVLDTVAIEEGPPLRRGKPAVRNQVSVSEERIYASRPLFAAGADWVALAHGARPRIEVRSPSGDPIAEVRWPAGSRAVSDADRMVRMQWSVRATLRADKSARATYDRMSQREREQQMREFAERLPFSDQAPEIMGLHGAGNCLMLAGFSPADSPDGTARTWIVLNVASGTLEGRFRIPREDRHVRQLDARAIYASYRDTDDVPHVERYPFHSSCSHAP